eukprot:9491830-Lingulodinium_polyedra.AAC.1
MLRATRAGGVEGPLLLNSLLAYHFDPLIREWEGQGWGFSFDGATPVTHAFWADNLIFLAAADDQAQ